MKNLIDITQRMHSVMVLYNSLRYFDQLCKVIL